MFTVIEPDLVGAAGEGSVAVGVGSETVGVGAAASYVTTDDFVQVVSSYVRRSATLSGVQTIPPHNFWLRKTRELVPASEEHIVVVSTSKTMPPSSAQVLAKFWSPSVDQEETSTTHSSEGNDGHSEETRSSKSESEPVKSGIRALWSLHS